MKLAIHDCPGSFSDRWIEYCKIHNIPYKIVDCFSNDIIKQLKDCDGILWHWFHYDYRSMLFANQFTMAVNIVGLKSFPDVNTSWHFDDKVGQKYLLEAIGAPLINSYVFYTKKEALEWAKTTTFPKVFKLRGGASSVNVRLIKKRNHAKKLIHKAFSEGFRVFNRSAALKDRVLSFKRNINLNNLIGILKGSMRMIIPTENERMAERQKGYIYFQDFIPNNTYDTRLVVIGSRCFGLRRYNRKNDFRASGSGISKYEPDLFDIKSVKLAFDLSKKLKTQSLAFDFISDRGEFKLVEVSYCFKVRDSYDYPGYWDDQLNWHNEEVIPEYMMIEDFINSLTNK